MCQLFLYVAYHRERGSRVNSIKVRLVITMITFNVPVVYMARDIMILMRAISITGTLEGMGPKIANASKDKMIRTCIWPKLKKPSSKEFVF